MANSTLQKLREKYPQYNDIDDITLANKLVEKYPQYSDILDEVKQTEEKPKDFLPGAERVENLRKMRGEFRKEPLERMQKRPYEYLLKPHKGFEDIMTIGGQPIESAMANVGLEAQRGKISTTGTPKPLPFDITYPARYLKSPQGRDIVNAFFNPRNITEPAEFGDIPRSAGIPEPLSAMIGLGTAMAIPEVTSLGQFSKGIAKTTQQVSEELSDTVNTLKTRLPSQAKDDAYLLAQTKRISDIADDTKRAMGKEINDFFTYGKENAYGRIPIEKGQLKNIITDLFSKYGDEAEKLEAEDMLKNIRSILPVEFDPNVYAAKVVKDAISEYIPESVWLKGKRGMSLTPLQAKRVRAYWKLDKLIRDNLPEEGLEYYDYMNKKATDVYRTSNAIKNMVTSGETGEAIKTGGLMETFMGAGKQAGKRLLINRLNELNNATKKVINKMNHYRKMQVMKGFTKKAGGAGLGYGLLYKLFGR